MHAAMRAFANRFPRIAGGANRDRTGDLLLAKQALSQLSYGPGCEGAQLYVLRVKLVGGSGWT